MVDCPVESPNQISLLRLWTLAVLKLGLFNHLMLIRSDHVCAHLRKPEKNVWTILGSLSCLHLLLVRFISWRCWANKLKKSLQHAQYWQNMCACAGRFTTEASIVCVISSRVGTEILTGCCYSSTSCDQGLKYRTARDDHNRSLIWRVLPRRRVFVVVVFCPQVFPCHYWHKTSFIVT